jgi:carboxyl-terminal processing protease
MRIGSLTLLLAAGLLAPTAGFAQPHVATLPSGVWQSEGYGYVAVVDPRRVRTFDISAAGCVRGPTYTLPDFHSYFGAAETASTGTFVLNRPPSRDTVRQLERLPTSCSRPLKGSDRGRNIAVFAQTFAELYPFFEQRGVDWAAATQAARAKTDDDLFEVLAGMVRPLNDGHVTIAAGERSLDPETVSAPGAAPDGSAWGWKSLRSSLRDYVQGPETPLQAPAVLAGNRRVLYGRLPDGIGYLAPLAMGAWVEGQTDETASVEHVAAAVALMDQIVSELGDTRGMVVDLRLNSGGFDAVAMEIVSRFAAQRTLAFRKRVPGSEPYDVYLEPGKGRHFSGPVAVLIGDNTVSAGETAALAFASLPQAHLLGQPTRGILSDAIPKTLPNGWTYTLSVESVLTPEGVLAEVVGVQPDTVAPLPNTPAAGVLWGRDIQAASTWLKAQMN